MLRTAIVCALLVGCGGPRHGGGMPDFGLPGSDGGGGDVGTPVVYANSDTQLYQVDPDTLAVSLVGDFGWPNGSDAMTDIAIDKNGHMVGISFGSVYAVDPTNANCTYLAALDRQFNSLSFVPAHTVDATDVEVLVAAALDGSFYRLDPMTGASTPIGNYGSGMGSSGDIVSVTGLGTIATCTLPAASTDWLVRVDAATGAATPIADTHATAIWGLGFWKNKVFGFTNSNQFLLIDPSTGVSTIVQTGNVSWWGAGVTTAAPVIM